MLSKRVVMALATKLNIIPDSNILFGEALLGEEELLTGLTIKIANTEPAMANKDVVKLPNNEVSPRLMHEATPRRAPPETPKV